MIGDEYIINFDKNYNKLDCPIGHIFTTLRKYTNENVYKYDFHTYTVTINDKPVFKAELIAHFPINLHDVTLYPLIEYDTDNSPNDVYRRYKDYDQALLLIFKKTEIIGKGE